MNLEAALRRNDPAPNPELRNEAAECDKPDQSPLAGSSNEKPRDSPPPTNSVLNAPPQERVARSSDRQVESEIIDLTETNLNAPPISGAQEQAPSPAQIIAKFSEFTQDVSMGYRWIRAHENLDPHQNKVFARLPTYQQVRSLIEPIVETLQQHGVVIATEALITLLDEQYAAGPDSHVDNPARWAIINSFFAAAMLSRSTTDFLAEVSSCAWNYFKNAFATFPELITQSRDVLACEALLSMAMFVVQCTADAQLILQITSAITRLVQTLGFDRKRFYLSLDPVSAQRYQRVFWVAYILDVDGVVKYDMSPGFGYQELPLPSQHGAELLDSTSKNPQFPGLLRWRAELAVIQRRIHERLHPAKTIQMKREELRDTTILMDDELQKWKRSLPEQIWAMEHQDDESDSTMSIALLHYIFHDSIVRVHMALFHLRAGELSEIEPNLALGDARPESEIQTAWTTCTVSARNTIEVVIKLPPQPFFQLWYVARFTSYTSKVKL